MKNYVFNIGFNKSGTTSLTEALIILNIHSLHYFVSNNNKTTLEKIIKRNIKNNNKIFTSLDQEFRGFSDFSGQKYYKLLDSQYPNSKFILTTRPFLDWFNSYTKHKMKVEPEEYKTNLLSKETHINAVKRYYDGSAEIKNFFKNKPDQFLEMKICEGEGWETLCPFLGVDIPNVPFPYLNKSL